MPLHFVGQTLDKTRSHYQAETGRLVQLMRGIYVDAGDDIDATVLKHAVRIALYLYPKTYLSAASAFLLGPTRDGRLFLSGRRNQRTRIRALEIIQNQAPAHPSVASAVIDDGMGEFRVDVSSIRQRFLEAFRLRSEHAASIDDAMRESMATRLTEEYGSPKAAADALWTLGRENQWHREAELAERFLTRSVTVQVRNEAALDLIVAWHDQKLGHLVHDGFEWRWLPDETYNGPKLIRQTMPGKLPPFIISLLPEGWLEKVLKDKDERALLRSGRRYMSNITIVEQQRALADLPPDLLLNKLADHAKDGVFTGAYAGPGRDDIAESFERNLAAIYARGDTPRLSGVHIKAPMYLDEEGTLLPSTGRPFTHILKPAGTSGLETLPLVEWLSLNLGRAAGFDAPATSLVPMPHGLPPALIVERFDIRQSHDDTRMFALEDLCSVLDLPAESKYTGTMERIVRAVRPLSTAPEEDLLIIIKRALFAWLIADGDMHLKNMALLKIAQPGERQFRSVRMAPLYDAVTTRVFPNLEHDRMALKLNGKDDRLRRSDFRALATIAGLTAGAADAAMDDMAKCLSDAIGKLALPALPGLPPQSGELVPKLADIVRSRIDAVS